jgi:hypothetical protein
MPILGIIASSNYQALPAQYIISGSDSLLLTSPDGITWSVVPNDMYANNSPTNINNLKELNGNLFFTANQVAQFSANGTTWSRKAGGQGQIVQDAIWDGTQYVAVGGGQTLTSTDFITWTYRDVPTYANYFRIAYGAGETAPYVAITENRIAISSTDGITWTSRLASSAGANEMTDLIYANGIYVAVGDNNADLAEYDGYIITSTDGVTWTGRTPSTGTTNGRRINGVAWNGTYFLAATDSIGLQYSTDGTTWVTGSLPTTQDCVDVEAISDGTALLMGENGTFYTSTNGTTWTSRTDALISSSANKVAYFSGNWYIATDDATNAFAYSSNFTTWTAVANGSLRQESAYTRAIKKVSNDYWIVGNEGTLYTSTDLLTFTKKTPASLNVDTINDFVYGNSTYVIAGVSGLLDTSTDGTTWTTRTSGFGTTTINTLQYGESLFIAAGNAGVLRTSTNAISWTGRTSQFGTSTINNVTYESSLTNKFVAVGAGGRITTSTNGTTWTGRTSNLTTTLNEATFGNGIYVAVGVGITTSTDGVTWTSRTVPGTGFGPFQAVKYNATYGFLAMGDGAWGTAEPSAGYITSTDGITWTSRTTARLGEASLVTTIYSV